MTLGDNMEYIQQNKVGLPGFGFFPPSIIELLKNLTQVRIVRRMLRRRIVKIPVSPASVYKTEAIDCTTSRLFDLPRCWVSKNHLPGHIERKYSPLYHSLLLNQLSQPWSCWIFDVTSVHLQYERVMAPLSEDTKELLFLRSLTSLNFRAGLMWVVITWTSLSSKILTTDWW